MSFFYHLTVYLNAYQTLDMSAKVSLILVEQKWVSKREDRKCKEERSNESNSWRGMSFYLKPVMAVTATWEVIIELERHSQQCRGDSENVSWRYLEKNNNSRAHIFLMLFLVFYDLHVLKFSKVFFMAINAIFIMFFLPGLQCILHMCILYSNLIFIVCVLLLSLWTESLWH